jgi:hypothetical protein
VLVAATMGHEGQRCSLSKHRWVFCKDAIKYLSSKKKLKPKMENSTPEVTNSSSNL